MNNEKRFKNNEKGKVKYLTMATLKWQYTFLNTETSHQGIHVLY